LFSELHDSLRAVLETEETFSVFAFEKLAIGLEFLTQGHTARMQAYDYGRPLSTIEICRKQFVKAVISMFGDTMSATKNNLLQTGSNDIPSPGRLNRHDKNYFQEFAGCSGAIDGSHFAVNISGTEDQVHSWYNRKGYKSTNVMLVTNLLGKFCFCAVGAEGSMHDSSVTYNSGFVSDYLSKLPNRVFVLGDAGFPLIDGRILTPFKGVRYHLSEFGTGRTAPQNPRELYNLRHSKLRNIIERAIGWLKNRFRILRSSNAIDFEFFMNVIMCCCLVHNMINQDEIELPTDDDMDQEDSGDDDDEPPRLIGSNTMIPKQWRNLLANKMWHRKQQQNWHHS